MDFANVLKAIEGAGHLRELSAVDGPQGAIITYAGRDVVNMASNNYMGLAAHPRVVAAAKSALDAHGLGGGAARLMCGNHRLLEELEARLAALKGTEAALLFGSGYSANLGILQALAPEGRIFCDRLDHASLIDGARLAGADLKVYPHRDVAALEAALSRYRGDKLIATDGVFSMDGDIAPLAELAATARRHGAQLMVDDAHGTGVLGEGKGSVHAAGLSPADVPVQMGTLGKALGGYGAFVAGSRDLIDYLVNTARSFIFTTAPPPAVAAGVLAALDILEGPEGRERMGYLAENRAHLAAGLAELGYPVPDDPTPIIPVPVGDARRAMLYATALFDHGVLAPAVRPPTVPEGQSRLRLTVMADHTTREIDQVLRALESLSGLDVTDVAGIHDVH